MERRRLSFFNNSLFSSSTSGNYNFFYSEPTSPSRPTNPTLCKSQSSLDESNMKTSPDLDNIFDSDSSQTFHFQNRRSSSAQDLRCFEGYDDGYHHQLVADPMDEFIHDGKLLPLKLPPRLQRHESYKQSHGHHHSLISSTATSPGSKRWKLKMPFQPRRSLSSNDIDFDPFLQALEKVKGSKSSSSHTTKNQQRSRVRSLPLLKWGWRFRRSQSVEIEGLTDQSAQAHRCSPAKFNGLLIGRPHKTFTLEEKGKECRRPRLKRFLFRSRSAKENEGRDASAVVWKPNECVLKGKTEQTSTMMRMSRGLKSLVKQHRARLLFCKRFGN